MTTINAVGNGLSGTTGTGNFVGATSPTLITPTLGVATATSINFGGSALSTNTASGSFTPTFTFATPGNLSVSYTAQVGFYAQVGSIIVATININCTPTFTTASGLLRLSGLPVTSNSTVGTAFVGSASLSGTYALGANTWVVCSIAPSTTYLTLIANEGNTTLTSLSASSFTTGSAIAISASIIYLQ